MENTQTNTGKTISIIVEKLQGGFVSNATGRRSIYKDAEEVLDVVNIEKIFNTLEDNEYHVDINIVPKDAYLENKAIEEATIEDLITLEGAKDSGLIEKAETFNPMPKMAEPDISSPIKVTAANAYSVGRLKAIDWAKLHEQLPMMPSEITAITNMNTTTLYASLPKARKGEFSFQNVQTRIGFTILAQYYERTLGVRSSTQDKCEKMKEDLLKLIREVEVIYSGKPFVKVADISPKLVDMRKTLL